MLRLFLGIAAFLTTSLGGLWYSASDTPLDETTFENEPIALDVAPVADTPVESSAVAPITPEPALVQDSEKTVTPSADPTGAPAPTSAPVTEKSPSDSLDIRSRLLRFGYRTPATPRSIDTIVLHSSYNALGGDKYSVERTLEEYEQYGVGAHYLIDRSGTIFRLVEEVNIAYHAGASKMTDGRRNVNDFSIGIEIIATEDSGYTDKQYAAVNALARDIKVRHKIKSVVGHGDIAPGRKTDPWKFNWKELE